MEQEKQTTMVRTTLSLPADLLIAADEYTRQGKARSRNEFVATALRQMISQLKRQAIDAEFERMVTDEEYRAETAQIEREFERASWERRLHTLLL